MIKNKFLGNTSWIIGGKIIQSIISLVVGALIARYLGPNNYGVIAYVASYIAFFTSFATLGLNNVIVKELVSNKDKQGEILGTALVAKLLASFISVLCIIFLAIVTNLDDKIIWYCSILQSISLLFQAFDVFDYWYQSQLKSKICVIITLIAFILTNIYKIFLLILNKNIIWFAFSQSLDYLLIAILMFISYKISKGQKLRTSISTFKILFKQSSSFIIAGFISSLYGQMDKIMIKAIMGDIGQVGLYNCAVSISSMWVFVLAAIITSATPLIMELHKTDYQLYEKRLTQLYSAIEVLSIIVSTLICIFSKPIIFILYGKEFLPAQLTLCVLTWYTMFSYLGVAKNVWIVCENKQKYVKYFALGGTISNLILNFIFIPIWGITGAAFATFLTQIITNIIMAYIIKPTRANVIYMLKGFLFWKNFNIKALFKRKSK